MLDVYNSGEHQWTQWATSFYEQHSDRAFTVGEVLQSIIDRHGLHFAVSVSHSSPSHSSVKHVRDLTPAVNMIEEFVAKAYASCGKQFKPQAPKHKMCDGCFSWRDKKPDAQESFTQCRKFKTVKKNAESDDDHQLEGSVSSAKSGGVKSSTKSDDKTRDSTKTRLKARVPRFGPVLRPEGSRDFYQTHLMSNYLYTGPTDIIHQEIVGATYHDFF